MAVPANGGRDTTDALFSGAQPQDANSSFSADSLGFSFDDSAKEEPLHQRPVSRQSPVSENSGRQNASASQSGSRQGTPVAGGASEPREQSHAAQDQSQDSRANDFGELDLRDAVFQDDVSQAGDARAFEVQNEPPADAFSNPGASEPERSASMPDAGARPKTSPSRKKKLLGMTMVQFLILGAILLCWICLVVGFAIYITFYS
jgi:hypothetical protein